MSRRDEVYHRGLGGMKGASSVFRGEDTEGSDLDILIDPMRATHQQCVAPFAFLCPHSLLLSNPECRPILPLNPHANIKGSSTSTFTSIAIQLNVALLLKEFLPTGIG